MAVGPAAYLGRIGSTGMSTGPHGHFEVLKEGKRYPFSKSRTDIGQYLQYRKPGEENWTPFYTQRDGQFIQDPGVTMTSPMGMRKHPVTGEYKMHGGEDWGLPEGTQLRFLGQGKVATHSSQGGAGNVSSLRTGPYEVNFFHMSELPPASSTTGSGPVRTGAEGTTTQSLPTYSDAAYERDVLKSYLFGRHDQYNLETQRLKRDKNDEDKDPSEKLMDTVKKQIFNQVFDQALNPFQFLQGYTASNMGMGFNPNYNQFGIDFT